MLISAAAASLFAVIRSDPSIVLVYSMGGADWIRMPEALHLTTREPGDFQTSFRTRLAVQTVPSAADLQFRALQDAEVYVNSVRVAARRHAAERWKETRIVDLAAHLRPGDNTIQIEVHAQNAPRLLWATAPALSLRSNSKWETSSDGQTWVQAWPASAAISSTFSASFQKPWEGLLSALPLLGPLFLLVCILHYLPRQKRYEHFDLARVFTASRVRWMLILAWVVLAGNNMFKIPAWVGFDISGHFEYIHYIQRSVRIPLADEGWQMFQSPLYYLLSALPYAAFERMADQDTIIQLLRFFPLLCGMMQVEICYRVARRVYPEREDMQIVCTTLGGLLPVNLYISQYIGNEPLAGALSALVILWCIYLLTAPSPLLGARTTIGLAALLGCALLTKVTALLLVPPVCLVVYFRSRETSFRRRSRNVLILVAGVAIVSGWYYVRNWVELGKPFVGGWEANRGFDWWQDPGYRTPAQFLRFGWFLVQPIAPGTSSMLDGLYSTFWLDGLLSSNYMEGFRPPWNYSFVVAGAWLALLPSFAMLVGVGMVIAPMDPARKRVLIFALSCLAIYLAAYTYMHLSVPVFAIEKAHYIFGLTPICALLGTLGMDVLGKRRLGRAVSRAWFCCWALSAYVAYFVL
jgi:hypothetical protein